MADPESRRQRTNRLWRRGILPILTYLVIAFVGARFIRDEPFQTIWVVASGFAALIIWWIIDWRLARRSEKKEK
jgi:hypothetical protein